MTAMKCRVDGKAFIQALDKVSGLIRRSDIPVLDGVLVRCEQDYCTLAATNLDSWLSIRLPAQGDGFSFLLGRPREAARAFRQFDGELLLELAEAGSGSKPHLRLALSCGPRSAELIPFPPEDFPPQPEWEAKDTFTANAAALYASVARVKYAVAPLDPKDSRACRYSIQFSGDRVYAVDGYRMACDINAGLSVPAPFMAPPAALEHLKLFDGRDVTIRLGERYASVSDGETSLTFRLPEGELFKPEVAIPNQFKAETYLSPKEFLGELDYLKRALRGKGPYLVVFRGGRLSAESQGERYATKIEASGSESITFGANLDYMADALEQFKGESLVKLKFSGPMGPIIIEAEGRNDYAMVLPVRIKESSAAA